MRNYHSCLALLAGASLALTAVLPADADAQRRGSRERDERRELPSRGEPGVVAAADLAFAKAARENGQWAAFAEYAASGAVIHGEEGLIDAAPWLAGLREPEAATSWEPNEIWTSCDGTMAVTTGRFEEADGTLGSYATVWELQNNRDYKWTYMIGSIDDPQPPPRIREEVVDDGDTIIVPGLLSIDGKVADCRARGAEAVPPPTYAFDTPQELGEKLARDATMRWRWEQHEDGRRVFLLDFLRYGEWQQVLDLRAPDADTTS